MPLLFSPSFVVPFSHINHHLKLNFKRSYPPPPPPAFITTQNILHPILNNPTPWRYVSLNNSNDVLFGDEDTSSSSFDIEQESPWEGSVVYHRNPSISHLEYSTTLERLGLGHLSTEVSTSKASIMGLRLLPKAVKDYPLGTPVLISIDVTRKRHKLRLDGILRTVLTLPCNRCGEPTAECVFSNFSLLLTEEPIEEPETINMGVIFGEDKFRTFGTSEEEEDDESSIDLDDRLYFPPEEKSIDISKHVRDLVHVEITLNALCDPKCKGLCLKCGSNLNTTACICSQQGTKERGYGPLGGLRKQMQQN